MTDRPPPRVPHALWLRLLALVALVAGFAFFVRANDAEATAIFDAGGDAGLWSLGILVAAMVLSPAAILLLASLPLVLKPAWGSGVGAVAGLAVLAPSVWLVANSYPHDQRVGGVHLDPGQLNHVANLYLAAFILLGLAAALLLVSTHPALTDRRQTDRQLTPA
ncbi:hypothetical protein DJ010_03920 [Nocardioides silvaticus]|uniref:Uncharacterized protein n=1 Tax=Nocardioides silvaticus TaxID=2201891 RepID=A0A316TNG6_9ACTN|nr:hypothetical protein [Nocardioides silvaticus]PWN04769.1 hypothetical protein DJ010_03920 [Nocardioides silvaticus]